MYKHKQQYLREKILMINVEDMYLVRLNRSLKQKLASGRRNMNVHFSLMVAIIWT